MLPFHARALRRTLLTLAAIAILSATTPAQTLPPGVRTGPSMAGITEYTYPNGLRVLLLPDSGSSTITVNAVYLVVMMFGCLAFASSRFHRRLLH